MTTARGAGHPRLVRSVLVVVALAAGGVVAWWTITSSQPAGLCVVGDVRAREAAALPDRLRSAWLDAEQMQVGLGSVALDGWESLGDGVVAGGRAWARSTRRNSNDYYRLLRGSHFQSSHFVYVPRGMAEAGRVRVVAGDNMRKLASALLATHGDGVLAAGYLQFRELRTIAIAEPPIAGVSVRQHAARYYRRPMEQAREHWAYVVLVALPAGSASAGIGARIVAVRSQLALLAHAVTLREAPPDKSAAPPAQLALSVGEVIWDSLLNEGELALYPVRRIVACDTPRG